MYLVLCSNVTRMKYVRRGYIAGKKIATTKCYFFYYKSLDSILGAKVCNSIERSFFFRAAINLQ